MSHPHAGQHGPGTVNPFTAEFWDERYGNGQTWSGDPNPHLVRIVASLAPGTALDAGCGEGADSIWLAQHGWQVTAADLSAVGLRTAAEAAARAGEEVASRITWQQADFFTWEPAPAQFDLVTSHFLHLPRPAIEAAHRLQAAAVRPGGTLLIVGHHPAGRTDPMADLLLTEHELADLLDPAEWATIEATSPERPAILPAGEPGTHLRDTFVHAVKRR